MTTDHSDQIARLRQKPTVENRLAADLLELHDRTGISLDNWDSARTFVERRAGGSITPNGA